MKSLFADIGLLYAALIWGSTFFIVKNSLASINPVILVAYRFILASFLLGIFLILKKKPLFSGIKKGMILGLFLALLYLPQTIGLKYTTASNSAFITGIFVIFVPFFAYIFFKKKSSKMKFVSVIIICLGLFILTGGLKEFNLGDGLTLITAMAAALHILFADKYVNNVINKIDIYALSFQQFLFAGLLSLFLGIVSKAPLIIKPSSFSVIVFLAIFPTLSAFMIQIVAQKYASPVKVAIIFSMEPVFAAIFAWTLGHENFILSRAFGGLLIFSGIIFSELQLLDSEKHNLDAVTSNKRLSIHDEK